MLIGLGNPGPKYARTRHNAGFMALDRIGEMLGLRFDREMLGAFVARGETGGHEVALVKPQTYMNLSGGPVAALARKFSIKPDGVTVLHDDIDVPLGKVKDKIGGGAGGHNGVSSVAQHLGTPDFRRIRIGVGRPPEWQDAADYVLASFEPSEEMALKAAIEESCRRALDFS